MAQLNQPPQLVAHSPNKLKQWHELETHLEDVAALATAFATPLNLAQEAELLGWWHDAGKAHHTWQAYLVQKANNQTPQTLDHSSVGALCLTSHAGPACNVLAWSIACHHGGLCTRSDLCVRLLDKGKEPRTQGAMQTAIDLLVSRCDPKKYKPSALWKDKTLCALLIRMMHSCLVDADCLDTERHFNKDQAQARDSKINIHTLWKQFKLSQEHLRAASPASEINRRRDQMYNNAVDMASEPTGIYSLQMPTGAGKTLTSMAFALKHATTHDQKRVIVTVPYTSIIEQNAQVYRKIFGDEAVLEHHSSTSLPLRTSDESDQERWQRLAAQNWDAPIIVTTNVQLFESLFAAQNSKLRKLHNIANSVIILDEVQTLPPKLLAVTLRMLSLLVKHFNCTIVFSTATLPAFSAETLNETHPLHAYSLPGVREIIQDPEEHFAAMRRVQYTHNPETLSWEDLAEALQSEPQCLVILNTVRDAQCLLKALQQYEQTSLYHLSTRLCGEHRREVLKEVHQRLKAQEPCLLISTQVIEAGVDLDFPVVWRAMGPLDSIVQAAGRCNREGKRAKPGQVYIFHPEDGRIPPGVYKSARDIAQTLLKDGVDQLHERKIHQRYFSDLYGNTTGDAQPLIALEDALDFPQIATDYKLIDEDTLTVLVHRAWAPSSERDQIDEILDDARQNNYGLTSRHMRALQPYLVSIRRRAAQEYQKNGLIVSAHGLDLPLWSGGYDQLLGLTEHIDVDQLIF